jgi:Uma2 family endonuclease
MLQWADVLKDKSLRNLPYKVELDRLGRVLLTPRSNRSGIFRAEIGRLLDKFRRGGVLFGCSIETFNGVQVADVAWASREFLRKNHFETPYRVAPEICVEVASFSVSREIIEEKIMWYLSKGAREVWVCDKNGNIAFHDYSGKLKKSKLVAKFPSKISIRTS